MRTYFYYVLYAVFASCFYVLFKFRFVREATQGGTLFNLFFHPSVKSMPARFDLVRDFFNFFILKKNMYVCMYVCMYIRMYECIYVCIYVCMYICTYMLRPN
jgi:hypothetical protein